MLRFFLTFTLRLNISPQNYFILCTAIVQLELSFPTLVPSPVLGITSSITRLKSSPKDRQDLFDFAIVGPLAGMLCSAAFLFLGLALTASTDPSLYKNLPALPATFLQGSTLVAGAVEQILGSGYLQATDPINTLIHLHPLAIAGYAGLIVNALNLTPYGSKFRLKDFVDAGNRERINL